MNILYISKYTVLPDAGAPTRQYFLSRYLSAIPGNKVMLVGSRSSIGTVDSFKGLYKEKQDGNLRMVTLNGPLINLGFNMKRLWSWLVFEWNLLRYRKHVKRFAPDVVIVSSLSILSFLYGVFLKKWLRIPLVIEIRDIYPLTLTEVGDYSPSHPAVKVLGWVEKLGYKNADLILSTLPNAKEHIASVLKRPFRFKWLPMGIDTEFYDDIQTLHHRKRNGTGTTGNFLVGYAGTIGKANALDVVFETAAELNNTYPDIQFVFLGDGPMKEHYIQKYKDLPNVVFKPAVPKKTLLKHLGAMDILINTWLDKPIYKFGISPNKWMDYMLAARPVLVAYNGHRCIIDDADCGIFVKAEDKEAFKNGILQLYSKSTEELDAMGIRGRSYLLKHHDYRHLAEELEESLASVLNSKNFTRNISTTKI
jgi:glycosyltransferase involved in cell wall biosynthesis